MKWSEADIKSLKDGYQNGMPPDEIAKELGRSKRTVISKASALGISNGMRVFTEEEAQKLKDWYEIHTDSLELELLAKEMGRTVPFLCRQAKKLGLTKLGRKPKQFLTESTERLKRFDSENPDHKYEALKKAQQRNKENPPIIPKRVYTEEEKKKVSSRVKAMWQDPTSTFNSQEFKAKRSQIQSEIMRSRIKENAENYSRGRGGRRKDLNDRYFRSSWEANFARYLNFLLKIKSIHKWEYEHDTFYFEKIKRGTRSYTPDFKVWEKADSKPYYVEIKGWMDDKSKTKLKRMQKYYPDVEIRLIQEREYKEIKNKLGKMLNFE